MKAAMILKQGVPLWLLIAALLAGCTGAPAPAEVPPAEEQGELKRAIEVEADGLTCHYLRHSLWSGEEFSTQLADQAQFEADFKEDFEQGLAQSDRPVSASDYSFPFDSVTQSTTIQCDVHGAISKEGNSYRATFFWLLKPLGLDFIDDNFSESEKGFSWEGSINGVATTIGIRLPTIDHQIYEAWASPIGHCHAHAWWSTEVKE